MNTIQKMILIPVAIVFNVILQVSLMWVLTFFLAFVFDTTIHDVACSPMVLIYVIGVIGIVASSINIGEYIFKKE